ncbi:MAG: histidine phosphatase family protein, partial [Candidatus Promineifilaceae bacterium]
EKGILQAKQTAAWFKSLRLRDEQWASAVYSSPMKRAVETAEILASALNRDVQLMENFREIDVGELEKRKASQADWVFHEKVMDDWYRGRSETRFPGGENYSDLWTRMREGYLSVTDGISNKHVIVVSHGGIMSITMKDLCPDEDPNLFQNSKWDNCAVTQVDVVRRRDRIHGTLVKWNAYDHLSGHAAELIPGVPDMV